MPGLFDLKLKMGPFDFEAHQEFCRAIFTPRSEDKCEYFCEGKCQLYDNSQLCSDGNKRGCNFYLWGTEERIRESQRQTQLEQV